VETDVPRDKIDWHHLYETHPLLSIRATYRRRIKFAIAHLPPPDADVGSDCDERNTKERRMCVYLCAKHHAEVHGEFEKSVLSVKRNTLHRYVAAVIEKYTHTHPRTVQEIELMRKKTETQMKKLVCVWGGGGREGREWGVCVRSFSSSLSLHTHTPRPLPHTHTHTHTHTGM
jgi:hypothetical protein